MKKADIIDRLKSAGVEVEGNPTVDELKQLAEAKGVDLSTEPPQDEPKLVQVKALRPISEGGIFRAAGEVFEVTADRAKAIAPSVITDLD